MPRDRQGALGSPRGCRREPRRSSRRPRGCRRASRYAAGRVRPAGRRRSSEGPADRRRQLHRFDRGRAHARRYRGRAPRADPFYGELGSLNPVVVTAAALRERGADIAKGLATSVAGSAGQPCTKPGFVLVPEGHGLDAGLAKALEGTPEHRLLTTGVSRGFVERQAARPSVTGRSAWWSKAACASMTGTSPGRRPRSCGSEPTSSGRDRARRGGLRPIHLPRRVRHGRRPGGAARRFVHRQPHRHGARRRRRGRLWALGVDVLSRGSRHLRRLADRRRRHASPAARRSVACDDPGSRHLGRHRSDLAVSASGCVPGVPQQLLPEPLRDDNPWGIPQRRSRAGLSRQWGAPDGPHPT